jgi:hypothetical protein
MNDWKAKGSKERHHWGWLNEMPYEGRIGRSCLVDGLYDGSGRKLRGLDTSGG